MRLVRTFAAALFLLVAGGPVLAADWFDLKWTALGQPCAGDCSVMVFGGRYVEDGMQEIMFEQFRPPNDWTYGDGYLVGVNAARRLATVFDVVDLELEAGIAKRFGGVREAELWGAMFIRYTAFPWNNYLRTTVALSTGLNYATGVAERELENAREGEGGSRVLHYLAPEITFALPSRPQDELVFRFHHRSGAFGLVSDVTGGVHFGTVGFRHRF